MAGELISLCPALRSTSVSSLHKRRECRRKPDNCSQVGRTRNRQKGTSATSFKGCRVSPGSTVRETALLRLGTERAAAVQHCAGRGPNAVYRDRVMQGSAHKVPKKPCTPGAKQSYASAAGSGFSVNTATDDCVHSSTHSNLKSRGRVSSTTNYLRSW